MTDNIVSLNSFAFDILETVRPNIVDDENIDERLIKYEIINQRALWLRNNLMKYNSIDPSIIQDLGCVDVELVDSALCCSNTGGCQILRTTNQIPDTIDIPGLNTITRVAPIGAIDYPFSLVSYSRAIFSNNGRFNKKIIFAFQKDRYIYLKSGKMSASDYLGITKISVQGVFEDPTDVNNFRGCNNNNPCYSDDDPFPLQRWLIPYIKTEVIKQLSIKINAPEDKDNDATSKVEK